MPVARCRNYALDFLKGLGCIGVVFIHITFPGLFGRFISRSSGFAVPLFFMISGFYAYWADNRTILKRLRKILTITLIATAIYALYRLQHMIRHDEFAGVFTAQSVIKTTAKLVILSNLDFIGAGHLWFLVSLIEAYIIFLLIDRLNAWKAAKAYVLMAFIGTGIIYACSDNWHLRGNVFMSGMCWVLMGHFIAENLAALSNLSRKKIIACGVAGYLIGLLSLTGKFMFIASIFFNLYPISLFILAVREDTRNIHFPSSIVKIGAEYSLYVYIFHIIVNNVLVGRLYSFAILRLGVPEDSLVLAWARPLVVVIACLILAVIIEKFRKIKPKC